MNPNSHIFTSTYRVKWLKSKLTQKVKINIDENNLRPIISRKINAPTNSQLTDDDTGKKIILSILKQKEHHAMYRAVNWHIWKIFMKILILAA